MTTPAPLAEKSVHVLALIAEGRSYAQIVDGHPDLTYRDIFAAAEDALRLHEALADAVQPGAGGLDRIWARHPRAYEKWTDEEDARLRKLHGRDTPVAELAEQLGRQ